MCSTKAGPASGTGQLVVKYLETAGGPWLDSRASSRGPLDPLRFLRTLGPGRRASHRICSMPGRREWVRLAVCEAGQALGLSDAGQATAGRLHSPVDGVPLLALLRAPFPKISYRNGRNEQDGDTRQKLFRLDAVVVRQPTSVLAFLPFWRGYTL